MLSKEVLQPSQRGFERGKKTTHVSSAVVGSFDALDFAERDILPPRVDSVAVVADPVPLPSGVGSIAKEKSQEDLRPGPQDSFLAPSSFSSSAAPSGIPAPFPRDPHSPMQQQRPSVGHVILPPLASATANGASRAPWLEELPHTASTVRGREEGRPQHGEIKVGKWQNIDEKVDNTFWSSLETLPQRAPSYSENERAQYAAARSPLSFPPESSSYYNGKIVSEDAGENGESKRNNFDRTWRDVEMEGVGVPGTSVVQGGILDRLRGGDQDDQHLAPSMHSRGVTLPTQGTCSEEDEKDSDHDLHFVEHPSSYTPAHTLGDWTEEPRNLFPSALRTTPSPSMDREFAEDSRVGQEATFDLHEIGDTLEDWESWRAWEPLSLKSQKNDEFHIDHNITGQHALQGFEVEKHRDNVGRRGTNVRENTEAVHEMEYPSLGVFSTDMDKEAPRPWVHLLRGAGAARSQVCVLDALMLLLLKMPMVAIWVMQQSHCDLLFYCPSLITDALCAGPANHIGPTSACKRTCWRTSKISILGQDYPFPHDEGNFPCTARAGYWKGGYFIWGD